MSGPFSYERDKYVNSGIPRTVIPKSAKRATVIPESANNTTVIPENAQHLSGT